MALAWLSIGVGALGLAFSGIGLLAPQGQRQRLPYWTPFAREAADAG